MDKVNEFEHGADLNQTTGVNTNFVSFPVESNLHYRFSSAEELLEKPDIIAGMIMHHYQKQVPRLNVLDDYYKAKNTNIMRNTRRKEKDKADHRAAHNFAKVLCTFDVGYNTGNPIKVALDGAELEQRTVDEFNQDNDIDGLNSEIWLDMDKYGRAYEYIMRNVDDQDVIYQCNVFETFVVYDLSIERKPILAVRYPKTSFESNDGIVKIKPEVYTSDKTIRYAETTIDAVEIRDGEETAHSHKEVPINEYSANRFRMGLYEDALSLIDLYDASQSDTANYMTDLTDALLVISGDLDAARLTTDDAIKQKEANMLLLQTGTDINGNKTDISAGYIYKQYDVNGVESYKDRVRKDIHEISMVPDLTDSSFSGTQSGEAMKYKLFGFQQMTSSKQRLFKKALVRRYRLLFNLRSETSELDNSDLKDLRITFTPNLPKAVLEELKVLVEAGTEISQETMLSLASFIPDVAKEMERIAEEDGQSVQTKNNVLDFQKE